MATAVLAAAAVLGTAYSVYSGERADSAQKRAVQRQAQAQKKAEVAAIAQERKSEMRERAANQAAPNVGTLLAGEQSLGGAASTMLTGPGGVQQPKRAATLLGE